MYHLFTLAILASLGVVDGFSAHGNAGHVQKRANKIAPKVLIFSMFPNEADVWYGIDDFDVLAQNITVPGLSPLFPDVHCTSNGDVCQMTIGEAGKFLKWTSHERC